MVKVEGYFPFERHIEVEENFTMKFVSVGSSFMMFLKKTIKKTCTLEMTDCFFENFNNYFVDVLLIHIKFAMLYFSEIYKCDAK